MPGDVQGYVVNVFISMSDVAVRCWRDGRLCQSAGTGVAVQGIPDP